MKLFLLSLLILNLAAAYGQITNAVPVARDSSELNIKFLSGGWENDSSKTKIEFKVINRELAMLAENSYAYHFFKLNAFPLQGVSITWPPHDCSIKKSNADQIEITFTNFGGEPVVLRYKKITASGI